MTPERWRIVTAIFHAALERTPDQRPSYLVEACRKDPSLRAEVDALLAGDDRAGVLGDPLSTFQAALSPGTVLGPYRVETLLDAGGMGEVYRARDSRLKRDVAIKVLPARLSADPDRLVRFEQEAHAAAALNHPNICAVFDIGMHDGAPFIVSELLEGETLRQRSQAGERVHHPEDRVKILDFGLAKLMNALAGETHRAAGRPLTEVGAMVGTVGYMSPEQVRGLPTDSRSDIFSFGTVLFEMLAGRPPFRGDTAADTLSAILHEDPPALAPTGGVPPELERIIRRCLEKAPPNRFQSADDLAFALEAVTVTPTAAARAAFDAPRVQARLLPAVITTALAVVAVAFAVAWYANPPSLDPGAHRDWFRIVASDATWRLFHE